MNGKPEAVITISHNKESAVWYNSKYDREFFYEEDPKYGWQFKYLNKKNQDKYEKFWKEYECTQKKN